MLGPVVGSIHEPATPPASPPPLFLSQTPSDSLDVPHSGDELLVELDELLAPLIEPRDFDYKFPRDEIDDLLEEFNIPAPNPPPANPIDPIDELLNDLMM